MRKPIQIQRHTSHGIDEKNHKKTIILQKYRYRHTSHGIDEKNHKYTI